jgi:hypothetical protein
MKLCVTRVREHSVAIAVAANAHCDIMMTTAGKNVCAQ